MNKETTYILYIYPNHNFDGGYFVGTYVFQGGLYLITNRFISYEAKIYNTLNGAEKGKKSLIRKFKLREELIKILEVYK